jgi:hypothetical protein
MYLVQPDLSEKIVGFSIKSYESDEYYSHIVGLLSNKLHNDISMLRVSTISNKKSDSATIFVFKILDYYITYGSMGLRSGHMKSLLLRYGPENGYAFPQKKYFTKVISSGHWGENTPFEYAFDSTFNYIGNIEKIGRIDSTLLHRPIEEILTCNFDCAYSSVLLWPDFSEKRMGYTSEPKEVFNFVHHLADLCGSIVIDDVKAIGREELDSVQRCAKNVIGISFDLIEKTMDFSILNTATKETNYHYQMELRNTSDWDENDEYSRKIEKVFKVVKKDYKKSIVNK